MKKWLPVRYPLFSYLFWGWLILVTLLSLLPSLGDVPNAMSIPHLDKVAHFSFYMGFCVLGILWQIGGEQRGWIIRLYQGKYLNLILLSLTLAVFYGMIIEVLQSLLTDTRRMEAEDMLANGLGALIGAMISYTSFPVYQTLIKRLLGREIEIKY